MNRCRATLQGADTHPELEQRRDRKAKSRQITRRELHHEHWQMSRPTGRVKLIGRVRGPGLDSPVTGCLRLWARPEPPATNRNPGGTMSISTVKLSGVVADHIAAI